MTGPRLGLECVGVCDRGSVALGRGAEIGPRLVARVREAGGKDDVTVVLARTRAARERLALPRSRS